MKSTETKVKRKNQDFGFPIEGYNTTNLSNQKTVNFDNNSLGLGDTFSSIVSARDQQRQS